ncbi:ArsR/SmtB family transcription factor [Nocardia testacea]|uniref:ArsR/SmtB family transcription factor n=1 Tax=Nocardia testacea TaxID=248551 RepID=A0ABW7VT29_9NOCA
MTLTHPSRDQIRIENVLTALGNSTRLGAVRVLDGGGEFNCTGVLNALGIKAKSTMTHHWRVLREAGIIRQTPVGREYMVELRRTDLDERYPGLLDTVLAAERDDAQLPVSG